MDKQLTAYDITAPTVITPPTPLNPITGLVGYIPQVAGSSGNLIFNDCVTLEEASIANQILSLTAAGAIGAIGPGSELDVPIENGLVISSVPVGMTLSVVYSVYVVG
jgi:hypothetical protein